MYNILIVDDEKFARESIKYKLATTLLEIGEVDEAEDAIDAIERIDQKYYPIIITDIKMPQMNGIEMIRNIREMKYDTQFIVVSGYNEFDYAHGALKYGVMDYLLKPVNETQLNEQVSQIIESYKMKALLLEQQNHFRSEYTYQMKCAKLSDWNKLLITEKDKQAREKLTKQMLQVDDYSFYQVILCHFEDAFEEKALHEVICPYVKEKLAKFCKEETVEVLFNIQHQRELIILHQYKKAPGTDLNMRYDYLLKQLVKTYGKSTVIGIGDRVESLEQVQLSYEQALVACRNKLIKGYNQIIFFKDTRMKQEKFQSISSEQREILSYVVKTKKTLKACELICKLLEEAVGSATTYQEIIGYVTELYLIILSSATLNMNVELDRVFLQKLYHLDQIDDIKELLMKYLKDTIVEMPENILDGEQIVKLSIQYIDTHYQEPISLETLSTTYHIHPNYLSRAFKKYSDFNFNEYLTNVKMKNAFFMLKNSDAKVQEVAEQLGYNDSKYFSKVFKKHHGFSPSQLH